MKENPIAHFIKYNNAVPVLISFLLLGAGGAFAATNPQVQQAVVQTTQTVKNTDNTYIAHVDLNVFPLTIEVKAVTEDADSYYVAYEMHTIDVADSVWQDVTKQKTLVVSKEQLHGGDLGVYVQKQLSEVRASEHERLVETQKIEIANGVTQKEVATVYSGLVGKFLDPKNETFPGYTPVVTEPTPPANPDVPINTTPSPTFDANAPIILPPVTQANVPSSDVTPAPPQNTTPPPIAPPAVSPPPPAASSTLPADTPPVDTSSTTPSDATPPEPAPAALPAITPPPDTSSSTTPPTPTPDAQSPVPDSTGSSTPTT